MLKNTKKSIRQSGGGLIDGPRTDKTGKVRSGRLNEFAEYWYESMKKQCWFSTGQRSGYYFSHLPKGVAKPLIHVHISNSTKVRDNIHYYFTAHKDNRKVPTKDYLSIFGVSTLALNSLIGQGKGKTYFQVPVSGDFSQETLILEEMCQKLYAKSEAGKREGYEPLVLGNLIDPEPEKLATRRQISKTGPTGSGVLSDTLFSGDGPRPFGTLFGAPKGAAAGAGTQTAGKERRKTSKTKKRGFDDMQSMLKDLEALSLHDVSEQTSRPTTRRRTRTKGDKTLYKVPFIKDHQSTHISQEDMERMIRAIESISLSQR